MWFDNWLRYVSDHLAILDVSAKESPVALSKTTYQGVRFTHQGWLANKRWRIFSSTMKQTRWLIRLQAVQLPTATHTYIIDLQDLTRPVFHRPFWSLRKATNHNQYVNDNYVYQSNYASGLHVLDISSVKEMDAASKIKEVASFDCFPNDGEDPETGFSSGAWSAYTFFPSGLCCWIALSEGFLLYK